MDKASFSKEQFECSTKKIQTLIKERENFFFYFSPDFDSVCSSLAFALYLKHIKKNVLIYFPLEKDECFDFLFKIADYNKIPIVFTLKDLVTELSAKEYVFSIFDTPNKALLPDFDTIYSVFESYKLQESIEIDHHFGNDSEQIFPNSLSLFKYANSCCDIIADYFLLCGANEIGWEDVCFPRNIVLTLLTGICSDTQLGKFCQVAEEKNWFDFLIERLEQLTWKDSANLKTPQEIFDVITRKDKVKSILTEKMLKNEIIKNGLGILSVPNVEKSENLLAEDGLCCSLEEISDDLVNILPEKAGKVGIFVYFDGKKEKYMIKIRRSTTFQDLDLRTLDVLLMDLFKDNFSGGGGHPGAVSFRISQNMKYEDFSDTVNKLFSIMSTKYFAD